MAGLTALLTAYQLVNYLIPGVLFAVFAREIGYVVAPEPLVLSLVVYFFAGLAISRVGSLIIEPLLRKIKFVEFAPYDKFVGASTADPKLSLLSETNNSYRTYAALFLVLLVLRVYAPLQKHFRLLDTWSPLFLLLLLAALFLASYRKQTRYVRERVLNNTNGQ